MKKTTRTRIDVTRVLATVVVVVGLCSFAAFLAGIWTGDDRWGYTGLAGLGLTFAAFVATAVSEDLR